MGAVSTAEPVSRRARAAKEPLSRALIVRTGLDILDSEGMDALTMRRVGQQLDTGAASLYVYVKNRDDLLSAMLAEALSAVKLPKASDGTWRERLTLLIERSVHEIAQHPRLALVAFGSIPVSEPFLRISDAMIGMLREGGLDDLTITWAIDLIYLFVTAEAADLSAYLEKSIGPGSEEAVVSAAQAELRAVPLDRLPNLASLQVNLMAGSGDQREAWARRALLNGILATPADT